MIYTTRHDWVKYAECTVIENSIFDTHYYSACSSWFLIRWSVQLSQFNHMYIQRGTNLAVSAACIDCSQCHIFILDICHCLQRQNSRRGYYLRTIAEMIKDMTFRLTRAYLSPSVIIILLWSAMKEVSITAFIVGGRSFFYTRKRTTRYTSVDNF
jgi:hypothetical protein